MPGWMASIATRIRNGLRLILEADRLVAAGHPSILDHSKGQGALRQVGRRLETSPALFVAERM